MRKLAGFFGALLLLIVIGFVATYYFGGPGASENSAEARLAKEQSARQRAMFAELCKTSGVRIDRTETDVEGVVLLKIRTRSRDFDDQYTAEDPYGRDFSEDAYIMSFLQGFQNGRGELPSSGYTFVDVMNSVDGTRHRYTAAWMVVGRKDVAAPNVRHELEINPGYDLNIYDFKLNAPTQPKSTPRYGVTYDDISTHEQRSNWIAGSSLKIIDLTTNEVIAERIGYLMDPLRGSENGGRMPWLLAADYACPAFEGRRGAIGQRRQTARFTENVLKPLGVK